MYQIVPLVIDVAESDINDLKARLSMIHWPGAEGKDTFWCGPD